MNCNPVSTAIELVDTAPSKEFLTTLHAQLLAEYSGASATGAAAPRGQDPIPNPGEVYVALAPGPSRRGSEWRVPRILLAAAACVAVFATGALIASRAGRPKTSPELHDVNQQEALPLARRALIANDALGLRWKDIDSLDASAIPQQAAATIDTLPDCAVLTSAGILPPTTKSAVAHQYVPGPELMFQDVFVFATPKDASRAMDVIAGDIFPECWFDFFDRLTPFNGSGKTSKSEASAAPTIPPHGDRQIIIGQHTTLFRSAAGIQDRELINAYVQVGRAIVWISPRVISSGELFAAEKAITAATTALTKVFGP